MKFDIKIFIVFLLVVIVFFASGQTGCQEEELKFNTTALVMTFVEDAPPSEFVTGLTYPIYVDIRNFGGYDIEEGAAKFYLSGIGDNLNNINNNLQNVNFLGKKTEIQEGGQERLTFATEAEHWKTLPASFDLIMRLDSCYKYTTVTQTSICVGESSMVCSIDGEKIEAGGNSAAPIQITSLTESTQGNKLYVNFIIENKGLGEVYLSSAVCDLIQEEDIDEKLKNNKVEISVDVEEGFTCNLQANEPSYPSIDSLTGVTSLGQVTCQKTLTGSETHLAPIKIVTSYIYRETQTKTLTLLPE